MPWMSQWMLKRKEKSNNSRLFMKYTLYCAESNDKDKLSKKNNNYITKIPMGFSLSSFLKTSSMSKLKFCFCVIDPIIRLVLKLYLDATNTCIFIYCLIHSMPLYRAHTLQKNKP